MPECYRLLAGAHDYLLARKWLLRCDAVVSGTYGLPGDPLEKVRVAGG